MRIIGWIREGDHAACGGTVVEGDQYCMSMGRPYSFEGARLDCPKNCVIAEGDAQSLLTDRRSQALHGMKTSGGCPLLSTLNDSDGVFNLSGADVPLRFVQDETGEWVGQMNEGYDQHFVLTDQQTGAPLADRYYRMTYSGKTIEGKTDAHGKTVTAGADDPLEVTIEIMPEGYGRASQ